MYSIKRTMAVLTASVILTGCSVNVSPQEPTEAPTESSSPTVAPMEDEYLETIRESQSDLEQVPDSLLVEYAVEACGAFDNGLTIEEYFAIDSGLDRDLKVTLAAAAVVFYCPHNKDLTS